VTRSPSYCITGWGPAASPTHTAASERPFKLPSLSYIDVQWEEPNLPVPAAAAVPASRSGLAGCSIRRSTSILGRACAP